MGPRPSPTSHAAPARDPDVEARLAALLAGLPMARSVYAYARLGSTMDLAHQLAGEGAPDGTVVWAETQDHGRGRLGRVWSSPPGGIYFSLITRPARPSAEMPQLTLVAGLAVAEAVEQATGRLPMIRWPNDVLLDDRKLAGILSEARAGSVIIGVGMNVATSRRHLPDGAVSLAGSRGDGPDRHAMGALICKRFNRWYRLWSHDGFEPVRERLRPRMALFGTLVQVTAGSHVLRGLASDVDDAGRLLVRLDSGVLRAFDVGEVTQLR